MVCLSRKTVTRLTIVAVFLLIFANLAYAELDTEWSRKYKNPGGEAAQSIIEASDGEGFALLGFTPDNYNYYDFYLVKTDSSGEEEWSKTYGGTKTDFGEEVTRTSNGGYALAGLTNSFGAGGYDFYLVKTDSAGNKEWSKTYGGTSDDHALSMTRTPDGGYALAGLTNSFGAGGYDFYLVKTDSAGNKEWSKTYGGSGDESAVSVIPTSDGGYMLAGETNSFGAGGYDFYLVKTDSAGNKEWSKTYGGADNDRSSSVIQTLDGGYAVLGQTNSYGAGGFDFYLVKTDSSGEEEWSKAYGGKRDDFAQTIIQTKESDYILAGGTKSFNVSSTDFLLVKVDLSGDTKWKKTFGGDNDDSLNSAIQTSDNGYALAGTTTPSDFYQSQLYLVKTSSLTSTNDEGIDLPLMPISIVALAISIGVFYWRRMRE